MTRALRGIGAPAAAPAILPARLRTSQQVAPALRLANVIYLGAWLGLATGLLEIVILFARRRLIDSTAVSALELNQHALWMIPLSHLIICVPCALLSAAVAWCTRRRFFAKIGVYGLCFVSALSLLLTYRGLSTIAYCTLAGGVACQLAPLALRQIRRPSSMAAGSFVLMAGLVGDLCSVNSGGASIGARPAQSAPAGAPNVLFIVLDTVRAQSLSLSGYPRNTSPNLVELARQGVRFDQARAPAAWTLPSHASMFTGRWPHELSTRPDRPLDATHPTLAEYLRDHGYATAGFVANTYFCSRWYGLGRGFVHYEDVALVPVEILRSSVLGRYLFKKLGPANRNRPNAYFDRKDAITINEEVISWLTSERGGRPFFAFLNYYDAHDPYLSPESAAHHFGVQPSSKDDLAKLRDWLRVSLKPVSPHMKELALDCYDNCIADLDLHLGKLFRTLDASGLLANTLVVITADHGEGFGEYGEFGHGQSLHRDVMNVPLLVVLPKTIPGGRVVTEAVCLRDLPATVVDLLGLAQQSPFPGRSLARHWASEARHARVAEEPILGETADETSAIPIGAKTARSLLADGKLYIRTKAGREELYDVVADPAESKNLAGTPPAEPLLLQFRQTMRQIDETAMRWHERARVPGQAVDDGMAVAAVGNHDLCD
jgi:arylsulfatase A-like enzyme